MKMSPPDAEGPTASSELIENASTRWAEVTNKLDDTATLVRVLGIDYIHKTTAEGGELYITEQGMEVAELLDPENWKVRDWFSEQRLSLEGTSGAYAVPTKAISGDNIALVVRYCRMGERVPIETAVVEDATCVEFNGPFEEIALIKELNDNSKNSDEQSIIIQRPLAIYVPPERWQPSQLGRTEWRVARKIALHPGITLDIMREYITLYKWIPGLDTWQAHKQGYLSKQKVMDLCEHATQALAKNGFQVLDMKPEHLIVEPCSATSLTGDSGSIRYSLIDHELLVRTPEGWQSRVAENRKIWSQRRSHQNALLDGSDSEIPARDVSIAGERQVTSVLNVRYVHGPTESTGGGLWVVGDQIDRFDDFLPERWRSTPRHAFADMHESYFTTSKDGLRLVWKVSQVGEKAHTAGLGASGFRVLTWGINSPFEEVSLALHLNTRGVTVPIPLAIYRTGHKSQTPVSYFDQSRFETHAKYRAFDGSAALDPQHNYIVLWEHWAGPESEREEDRSPEFRSINLAMAHSKGLITPVDVEEMLDYMSKELHNAKMKYAYISPTHILVALNSEGTILRSPDGHPILCLCNFKYLREQAD